MDKPVTQLSESHLLQRIDALLSACYVTGETIHVPTPVREILHAALDEASNRGIRGKVKMPAIIDGMEPLPEFPENALIRYSENKYLDEFAAGKIPFRLANSYETDAHHARNDNEMMRSYHAADCIITIAGTSYPSKDFVINQKIADDGNLIHYYLLSLSREKSRKLGRAFGADGYVIIHSPKVFFDLLDEALKPDHPSAGMVLRNVAYYDPLTAINTKDLEELINLKSIYYYYQHEARISLLDVKSDAERMIINIAPPAGLFEIVRFASSVHS